MFSAVRFLLVSALLLLLDLPAASAQRSGVPTFVVDQPTVIAFFAHVTDSELDTNPDLNEALGDFQLYASKAGPRLKAAGIHFDVASSAEFKTKIGSAVRTFRAGKITVGYYFIAPGRQPHVDYGVMTDEDILETASKYFKLPIEKR